MELKEFVASSIREIIAGIAEAQSAEGGELVNAASAAGATGGNLFNAGNYGVFTRIDFDVAVTAETSGKAGAGLKVFGAGIEAGGEHKQTGANRLTFSVPIRLPDGDTSKADKISASFAAANARNRDRTADRPDPLGRR
jgi:hypothetical protein